MEKVKPTRIATLNVDLDSNRKAKRTQEQIFDLSGNQPILPQLYEVAIKEAFSNPTIVKAIVDHFTKQKQVA